MFQEVYVENKTAATAVRPCGISLKISRIPEGEKQIIPTDSVKGLGFSLEKSNLPNGLRHNVLMLSVPEIMRRVQCYKPNTLHALFWAKERRIRFLYYSIDLFFCIFFCCC